MAHIHKATVYFIDTDEEFETVKDIAERMRDYDYLPYMKVGKEETKEFDWDDSVVVNRIDCTGEHAEEFFQNVPEKPPIKYYPFRVLLSLKNGVESVGLTECVNYSQLTHFTGCDTTGQIIDFYQVDIEAIDADEASELATGMLWKKIQEDYYSKLMNIKENLFKK